ncbi:hypothetical protein VNO77_16889 [Canavalia gladiata]|uniref:Uncharacterized protein n=1 Tax=Canavalia gladiata TaxID=3824 RepID=A0AAN9QIV4_CANGL
MAFGFVFCESLTFSPDSLRRGSKFRDPSIFDVAYKDPIKAKSVHFVGDKDWLKMTSEELASATSQLRNWIAQVLCQHKDGVSVCEHEIDHEEKSEKGIKLEAHSTNQDKV